MGTQRSYSREFKLSMIRLVLDDKRPALKVCQEHQIARSVLYRWLQEFRNRGEAAFRRRSYHLTIMPPKSEVVESPDTHIADLERLCGQLALENFLLRQALTETRQTVS